uniref:Uncharacterized protein LOC104217768 n=1 Tax=Nicotiana sylvestris TaxID=4096 RepID=A0A1U7VVG0_NICSY
MEDYYEHLNIVDEAAKIRAATMYLIDTAMLWWRRKKTEMEKGTCSIQTWEQFKSELKRQLYPQNVVNEARRKLRELKQTTSIREYVKEFTKLILQIPNMSGEDVLFYFMDGLQNWAKQELQRRQVKDVDEAIAVAESLTDFRTEAPSQGTPRANPSDLEEIVHIETKASKLLAPIVIPKEKATTILTGATDCPSLGKLSALIAAERRQEGAAQTDIQAGEAATQGRQNVAHLGHMMLGALLTKEPALKQVTRDKPDLAQMGQTLLGAVMGKEPRLKQKGSLFVDAKLNGQPVRIMVDTGATHNFVTEAKARSLGLTFSPSSSLLKTVNANLTNVNGVAHNVQLNLGAWQGSVSFFVAPMDVGPCVVPTLRVPQAVGQLSAMQIVKGFKRGEATFLAAVTEINEVKVDETLPPCVQQVLDENKDVMPEELPKCLPLRREVDHQIELIPGAKPPAMGPYRMAPPELEELRKQLKELLEAGHVRPSKAPFGAPVFFQKKQDGSLRLCIDYRALNKVTVKNKYPIPLIADLFDRLGQAKFVVIYLDDIVIYSSSIEEHLDHLRKVFQILRENNLFVKREKCSFAQPQVKFLGHTISQRHIRMDNHKVTTIRDWEAPTK